MLLIAIVPWVVKGVLSAVMASDFLKAFAAAGGGGTALNPNPAVFNQARDIFAREYGIMDTVLAAVMMLFRLAWGVMSVFASAVIYKKLRATWPAEETTAAQEPVRFAPGLSSK